MAGAGRHSAIQRFAVSVALGASAFAGLIASSPAAAAAPARATVANGVRLNAVEARLLARINAARASRKLVKLTVAAGYTDVARRWADTLAKRNVLGHNPNARTQLERAGGKGWKVLGENVGYGGDADSLFEAYWKSPSHRANFLHPSYRYIGIGWVTRADGSGYNAQNFVSHYSASYGPTRGAMRPV